MVLHKCQGCEQRLVTAVHECVETLPVHYPNTFLTMVKHR